MQKAICRQKAGKALGIDGIATGFLKAIGKPLVLAITDLLTGSWKIGYYPEVFRRARTIVLKKPRKPLYDHPKV